MSDPDSPETTAGGVIGQIVGKAKSAVGSLLGKDDLEREGNLQQAQAEAEVDARREEQAAELRRHEAAVSEQLADAVAERERLLVEIESEDRKEHIDETAARRESEIALSANQQKAAIEQRESLELRAADATEEAAVHRKAAQVAEAARLEQAAAHAERAADTIDPEAR